MKENEILKDGLNNILNCAFSANVELLTFADCDDDTKLEIYNYLNNIIETAKDLLNK